MKNIIVISICAVLCCGCGAKIETADVQKPPVKVRIITVGKSSNAENTTFSATIDAPAIETMLQPLSTNSSITPMWARPRAPPDDKTSDIFFNYRK